MFTDQDEDLLINKQNFSRQSILKDGQGVAKNKFIGGSVRTVLISMQQ